ncbi:MFS transporter [Rhodococcus tukisamuensis]|uniref:Na+/melibiose symporter n=1 Tax=Rhodococcus tukisamuensis TaxID=168276 RepID=A0A1G7AD34_9NOCA|nr:MFS transporter [Rhodococcus tukisamuensis]SDE12387.1 Na+/melibiose symporter [Rhodococcus tukisamuensis]
MTVVDTEGLEPTNAGQSTSTPPPRAFAARLAMANLGLSMALITPVVVTMQLRIEHLDPDHKERTLGLVLGIGALLALVGNPLAGRLSDRTSSRFGRRRPWLIGGALVGTAGLTVVATVPSIAGVIVGWCLAQLAFNAVMAALTATIPDHVPPEQRGLASGAMGFSQIMAIVVGVLLATALPGPAKFLVPAAIGVVLITAFAVTLPDPQVPAPREPFSFRMFAGSFWVNPRRHPDFGYAWLTRFLVMLGVAMPMSFLLFFLQDRIGMSSEEAAAGVATLVGTSYALTALMSGLGGWVSDKVARRKAFVIGSALTMSAGLALLATASTFTMVIVAELVIGIGTGLFFAVDMALVTQVLPDPRTAAKDLGVINIANALPQSLAPAIAPMFLAIGPEKNYPLLFTFAALSALVGAVLVTRIKGVN